MIYPSDNGFLYTIMNLICLSTNEALIPPLFQEQRSIYTSPNELRIPAVLPGKVQTIIHRLRKELLRR